ncbi:MAG: hypothetical protein QOD40_452 [Alphaproteobacteria bacterium]|nr:hypothetical protein [Alphaproteobacteria bacterium]
MRFEQLADDSHRVSTESFGDLQEFGDVESTQTFLIIRNKRLRLVQADGHLVLRQASLFPGVDQQGAKPDPPLRM